MSGEVSDVVRLAEKGPVDFRTVASAFDALEAKSPAQLDEAVREFEAASTHWPDWSPKLSMPGSDFEWRVTPDGYRTWGGEIYTGVRSKKFAVVRGVTMPAENWSRAHSMFNLNEASEDMPHLVYLLVNKGRFPTKYLKTWREEGGFWTRLRGLSVQVEVGAAQLKELCRSRLEALERLDITSPKPGAIEALTKAKHLHGLRALGVRDIQNVPDPAIWEGVAWLRGVEEWSVGGDAGVEAMSAFIAAAGFESLSGLSVRSSGDLSWIEALTELRTLHLSGNAHDQDALPTALRANPGVEHLIADWASPEGCRAVAAHPVKFVTLQMNSKGDMPIAAADWRMVLESGVLSEVEHLRIDQGFDLECVKLLETHTPKLERLDWIYRANDVFDYIERDTWLSTRRR